MIIGRVRVTSKCLRWLPIIPLALFVFDQGLRAEPRANPTTADELKQLNDPTLLVTHVSLESEWDQFKDGGKRVNWTFTGLWAWRVSDCQDWAIRFTLPFVYDRTDRGSGHPGENAPGPACVPRCLLSMKELVRDQITVMREVSATWNLGQVPRFV